MENKKNTNLLIGLGIVLVIVIVFWSMHKSSPPAPVVSTTPVDNGQTVTSVEDTSQGSVNAGSAVSTSYMDALAKYKNARLQLDKTCQASPIQMTFKNNSSLMVDNRAAVARSVKVGSVFSVKAYGFKIIKLSSPTLPATWYVDCDASQNVATILLEK